MDDAQKQLAKDADFLFTQKSPLNSHHQDIAENFYPPRADFTATHVIGYDVTVNLLTSIPVIAARDLASVFSSMLRPANQWFFMGTSRDDKVDNEGKQWLEWATGLQWRATYDPIANFAKATAMADMDYTCFGQAAISVDVNWKKMAMLYRTWHLRDMAWADDAEGRARTIYRKWKPTLREAASVFPGKLSPKLNDRLDKEPYARHEFLHCVVPSEEYKGKKKFRQPYVSIWLDQVNDHVIEETGKWTPVYVIPRWQTVSGSQYAHSPAVIAAFPDTRLIQQITLTLLEAGEKAVDPPRVSPAGILRSDLFLQAGGVTMYDPEYDEKSGEILRPIMKDVGGMPYAIKLHESAEAKIKEAFFLNKINMTQLTKEMTAYEVSQHVQENIRAMLPLFGPTEPEYNGGLCEFTFEELRRAGAFGDPRNIPDSIRGADVKFNFESPLHRLIEREKGQKFAEAQQLLAQAAELDQGAPSIYKTRVALRDALEGVGTPASWLNSEKEMQAINAANARQAQQQQLLAAMGQGAAVAKDAGAAGESFARMQQGTA